MWAWLARRPWITSLVLVTLVAGGAGAALAEQDAQQDRFAECVASWADASADRTRRVGDARAGVDAANDELWRTFAQLLAEPRPDGREVFRAKLNEYKIASDTYRAELDRNPIPTPPRLRCGR